MIRYLGSGKYNIQFGDIDCEMKTEDIKEMLEAFATQGEFSEVFDATEAYSLGFNDGCMDNDRRLTALQLKVNLNESIIKDLTEQLSDANETITEFEDAKL